MKYKLSWAGILTVLAVIAAGLFFVFNYTSPETAGPLGVLLVFFALYAFALALIFAIINGIEAVYFHFRPIKAIDEAVGKPKLFRRRTVYVSAALAFAPLFLLSLNSLGQLQIRDIFLVILIEALAILYIFKRV